MNDNASTQLLLLSAFRAWAPRLTKALADAGHRQVMPRHRQLFMHLDSEGTSVSTLARRMNISPAAMGALVDELRVLGYVNRQETAIARLVVPTAGGLALITLLKDFDDQIEVFLRKRLGAETYLALRSTLQRLSGEVAADDPE